MCEDNQTKAAEFFLLGFQQLHRFKVLLFIVFLKCFLVILNGNLLIIVLISTFDNLKIPMFFFLKHLAIADLMLTTTVLPLMLDIILKDGIVISVTACEVQLHCFAVSGFVQCFFIALMSYDRCLAICNPMHYNSIMKPEICLQMVVGSWMLVFCMSSEFILVYQLRFCGVNTIDHFFCDSGPLVDLSISDTSFFELVDFSFAILVVFLPFTFIIGTYVLILFAIVNISSANGRRKAFSTCSSHLATVCTYYGSLMAVYMTPTDERSSTINKFLSVLYIVATPMMNPIIYSLRNQEIRRSLLKLRNYRPFQ